MSVVYKVLWTHAAERDLGDITAFIASDNPQNALHVLEKIRNKAASLYSLPEQGRIVSELHSNGIFIYRELIISPWRLLSRIAESNAYVMALLDGRRNVEDILLNRLVQL